MKILTLLLMSLSLSVHAVDHYTFGELHFGMSQVDSTVSGEDNQEDGLYYGVGLGHEFKFSNDWNLNTSLIYSKHKIETELLQNQKYSRVKLDSSYFKFNLNPTYSLSKKFDLGLTLSTALSSEGILISQEESLKTTYGLNAFYNFTNSKERKFRVGLDVKRGSVDSDYMQAGVVLQYAFGWSKQKKTFKRKVFKKKEKVTTVTFEEDVVRFDNDSAVLSLKSKAFLAEVATFLSENSYLWKSVVISGHTSLAGEADYNKYLSYKRANSVFQVLKEMGVPQGKINIEGLGETRPKYKVETTSEQAKANRRVELKFVEMHNDKEFKRFVEILKKKHTK